MAKASLELITAIRETAKRVSTGVHYEWGHMAHCNCGHLVQTVTQRNGCEIARSINQELDEWSEHANDYCGVTGHAVEELFKALENIGFYNEDIAHLEKLSDRRVLNRLGRQVYLQRNNRDDFVLYLETLAELLEEELYEQQTAA